MIDILDIATILACFSMFVVLYVPNDLCAPNEDDAP